MRRRIACSGLVSEGGSVGSAGLTVLRELLARGYEIDFYSKPSYVYPEQLLAHGGFRYVDCSQPRIDRLAAHWSNEYARWLSIRATNVTYMRRIVRRMCEEHNQRRYDLQLF